MTEVDPLADNEEVGDTLKVDEGDTDSVPLPDTVTLDEPVTL